MFKKIDLEIKNKLEKQIRVYVISGAIRTIDMTNIKHYGLQVLL